MTRFSPEYFRTYRPYYPAETFAGLARSHSLTIADVGCGTGHSAVSVLDAGISAKIIGIDPDPEMLQQAQQMISPDMAPHIELKMGTGEETGLRDHSVDVILVGSAFHWMEAPRAKQEFLRILRPNGVLRLFEYQFPKADHHADLNEWIRRQFNLYWKAPNQKPRGNFKQILKIFREDPTWTFTQEGRPPMVLELSADQLTGHILSQSRVLHFLNTLSPDQSRDYKMSLRATIAAYIPSGETQLFDFKLAWVEFELT